MKVMASDSGEASDRGEVSDSEEGMKFTFHMLSGKKFTVDFNKDENGVDLYGKVGVKLSLSSRLFTLVQNDNIVENSTQVRLNMLGDTFNIMKHKGEAKDNEHFYTVTREGSKSILWSGLHSGSDLEEIYDDLPDWLNHSEHGVEPLWLEEFGKGLYHILVNGQRVNHVGLVLDEGDDIIFVLPAVAIQHDFPLQKSPTEPENCFNSVMFSWLFCFCLALNYLIFMFVGCW